jgi:GNAT superfamily N-acetyltransferase
MKAATESRAGCVLKAERATEADRVAMLQMYLDFDPKGAALGLPPRKDPQIWIESLSQFPNFVVKVRDRVVGHGALCIEGDAGETAVFVHQDWRGHGIGKLLLMKLVAEGRRRGLRRVWGMAAPDNFVMLRLADSLGFVAGGDPGVFHLDLKEENSEGDPTSASAA